MVKTTDFEYNIEQNLFVHNESDFMLDGDFVLLFDDAMVSSLFFGATGCEISSTTLEDLRAIVREHTEEQV